MENKIELYKNFLKTELKPLMKSLGYKTSGQHFYIENDDMIKYVSIEKSSWNMADNFSFWFVFSIFDKTAHRNLQEFAKISKIPHYTYFNIIRSTVTALKKGKMDTYYLNRTNGIVEFSNRIMDDLNALILPFIENIKTKKDLLELYKMAKKKGGYVSAGIFMDLAIGFLEIQIGDKQKGINLINNWIIEERKRGYWTEMANSLELKMKKTGYNIA